MLYAIPDIVEEGYSTPIKLMIRLYAIHDTLLKEALNTNNTSHKDILYK